MFVLFLSQITAVTKSLGMKLLVIVALVFAQFVGIYSIDTGLAEQRGFLDIWDAISPIAAPIALGIDTALGTISNIHGTVTGAVNDAIYGLTSWIGGKIPALGKRELTVDNRLALLNELKSVQTTIQQMAQGFFADILANPKNIVNQIRQYATQLKSFLTVHVNKINSLVASLISTIKDATADKAIASIVKLVQVIERAIQQI